MPAQSAANLQPWAFAVILDRSRIDCYAEYAKLWMLANWHELGLPDPSRQLLERPDGSIFYHAPALVLVMAQSLGRQAVEDSCLAAYGLMLAARDKGIGSCWVGFARPWLNLPTTKKELAIPKSYEVVAPVVLGYPKRWPESHGRNLPVIQWL